MILGREDWKGIGGEIIFSNLDIFIFYFAKNLLILLSGSRKSDAMWKTHSSESWCTAVCAWG